MVAVISEPRGQEPAVDESGAGGRGVIEGLPTPRPIGEQVPSVLQEDEFAQRMLGAFDEVLAPVFATLDCLDSYLDPMLAPPDFADWLAGWVGVDLDETWDSQRRRQLISESAALYRIRGTAAGLAAHLHLYTGVTPEITDSGACEWSQTADTPIPGSPQPNLTVRLCLDDLADVTQRTVSRIVAACRPAHVPYELELVVAGAAVDEPADSPPEPPADDNAPGAIELPGSERIELAAQGPSPNEVEEEEYEGETDDQN